MRRSSILVVLASVLVGLGGIALFMLPPNSQSSSSKRTELEDTWNYVHAVAKKYGYNVWPDTQSNTWASLFIERGWRSWWPFSGYVAHTDMWKYEDYWSTKKDTAVLVYKEAHLPNILAMMQEISDKYDRKVIVTYKEKEFLVVPHEKIQSLGERE